MSDSTRKRLRVDIAANTAKLVELTHAFMTVQHDEAEQDYAVRLLDVLELLGWLYLGYASEPNGGPDDTRVLEPWEQDIVDVYGRTEGGDL